jgi:hypothetical protein
MDHTALLNILAEDKAIIAYRPRFSALTDSSLASILLQQMIYWWNKSDCKPFYKFRSECSHKLYKDGDSWCEDLVWNTSEFDGALKVIGTKITKGISKTDVLNTEYPERTPEDTDETYCVKFEQALRCVVIYWTDSNRLTWYQVNETLLGKFLSAIYLDKSQGLRYLKKCVASFTQKNRWAQRTYKESETTQKTTKEIDANASAAQPETPDLKVVKGKFDNPETHHVSQDDTDTRRAEPTFAELRAVTAEALSLTGAAYALQGKYTNFLTGQTEEYTKPKGRRKPEHNGAFYELQITPGMTLDEIGGFDYWLRNNYTGGTPIRKPETLNDYVGRFRADKQHNHYVQQYARKRQLETEQEREELPVAAGAEDVRNYSTQALEMMNGWFKS